jgi:hypothetical protein
MENKFTLLDYFDHIYNKRGNAGTRRSFLFHLGSIVVAFMALFLSIINLFIQLII